MTLSQALNTFCDHLRLERDASQHTVAAYRRDLSQLVSWFQTGGDETLEAVAPEKLRDFCISLRNTDLQARSYNRKLSAMRSFFAFCLRQGWIAKDPTGDLRNLPTEPKSPEPLDVDQMAKVLEVTGEGPLALRDRALLELMYSTGMRVSEVVTLQLSQIPPEGDEIRILGKGKKERVVFVTKEAINWLRRYLSEGRHKLSPQVTVQNVFINHRGGALTVRSVQRMVRRRTLEAGISQRLTPHGVRHSIATHLLDRGLDLRQLQEMLGHESLSSTQVYTHLSVPRLKEVHGLAHPRSHKDEAS